MSQPPAPASHPALPPASSHRRPAPSTFERIARFPEPGWQTPRSVRYSPDGKLVTYLQSESQSDEMALFAFDLATRTSRVLVRAARSARRRTKPLSREEELRRERRRTRIARRHRLPLGEAARR